MIRILIIFFVFTLVIFSLHSQDIFDNTDNKISTVTTGLGGLYQISYNSIKNNKYFGIRHYGQFFPFEALGSNVIQGNYETSVLIGKAITFNTKKKGFFSYSAGLSLVETVRKGDVKPSTELYEAVTKYTIGLPLDINFTKGFTNSLAYGFNLTININKESLFGSFFFNLSFGNFENKNYDPNTETKPSSCTHISLDYPILTSLTSAGSKGYSIKPTIEIKSIIRQYSLIIPILYMKDKYNQIMNTEKELFFFDVLARRYFPKNINKYYLDIGVRYAYAYNDYEYTNKPHRNFGCIALSFGKRFYITKRFFISSQFNIAKPVIGDLKEFRHTFDQDIFSTRHFIIFWDILKFGYEI
jgi:hypothetical protein